MEHQDNNEPDYGTGKKKLGVYVIGFITCSLLTVFSFWSVQSQKFSKFETLMLILSSAGIQLLVQVVFFLRLTTKTKQGKTNIMSFLFTCVVLVAIMLGSLWIMGNLNYYMMH